MSFESIHIGQIFSWISIYAVIAIVAITHVLLNKRNSRAAFGWVGLIIVFPIMGALIYALFGVNRVRRKAQRVSAETLPEDPPSPEPPLAQGSVIDQPGLHITGYEPVPGNAVTTYFNGEQAYPPMLASIEEAQQEVLLSTYIFDNDETGLEFLDAMARARQRGCRVCLLVDDAGARYSFPTIYKRVKELGLPLQKFMPLRLFPPSFSINLRTHRKVLVCDRHVTYAGGMNIGGRQLVNGPSPHKAQDLHFRFDGPIATEFVRLFADDWKFCGGEDLDLHGLNTALEHHGDAELRLVADGPDEHLDALLLTILGVMSAAQKRIWIMSPYFLPERQMMGCLQAAALSGVDVKVLIPGKNNWPLVQWALQHNMIELLKAGVKIYTRPPPFAHSKCIIIDDQYSLVGSTNLDPRSLRLNFELGIEVFEKELNQELCDHFRQELPNCRPFTLERLAQRSAAARMRDATASMFTPYL